MGGEGHDVSQEAFDTQGGAGARHAGIEDADLPLARLASLQAHFQQFRPGLVLVLGGEGQFIADADHADGGVFHAVNDFGAHAQRPVAGG